MLYDFFIYMVKVTISLLAFFLAYRFFFTSLTHFHWRRGYLLGVLLLSSTIPLFPLKNLFTNSGFASSGIGSLVTKNVVPPVFQFSLNHSLKPIGDNFSNADPAPFSAPFILFFLYLAICIYRLWRFHQNLKKVYGFTRKCKKEETANGYLMWTKDKLQAFSFFNYIFIPLHYDSLEKGDLDLVIQHEKIHARQRHTLDLLFYEIAAIIFWFNPAVYYLRSSIRQVHEYLVDSAIAQSNGEE